MKDIEEIGRNIVHCAIKVHKALGSGLLESVKEFHSFAKNIKKEVFPVDINITIEVWQKGKWFVAKCPELDFISQGKTREEAKNNLLEVIQIQFEEMSQN